MNRLRALHRFFIRELTTDGQGLAEYALILALIAIIAIVALIFLGGQVSEILSRESATRCSLTARLAAPKGSAAGRVAVPR